jgi:hypothetical protein
LNTIFSKFSVILIITLSGVCLAGEKVNQSLSVETSGIVFVEIPRGHVKVQGWDKSEVVIQGELDDTINQLIFKTKKNKTLIKLETQGQKHWGDASVLKIFMPVHSQLRFKGIDTTFSIVKLYSHTEGKTINGDLMVKESKGKIKLSVVSGDVKVADSSGIAKIQSVNGLVDFSGDFEQAFIKSMSGDITADISGISNLTIENISGDTQINGPVKNQAQIKLSSVSGDILLKVTDDLNAECEVISQFGGDIDNQLTADLPLDGNLHKKTLSFVSGDGSGKLNMKTVTGSVLIEKVINE